METERSRKNIQRKVAENFPNLMKNINLQIQEAQQTPRGINTKRCTYRHPVKMLKVKEKKKILKGTRSFTREPQ